MSLRFMGQAREALCQCVVPGSLREGQLLIQTIRGSQELVCCSLPVMEIELQYSLAHWEKEVTHPPPFGPSCFPSVYPEATGPD